jgi:hypothetical protein
MAYSLWIIFHKDRPLLKKDKKNSVHLFNKLGPFLALERSGRDPEEV